VSGAFSEHFASRSEGQAWPSASIDGTNTKKPTNAPPDVTDVGRESLEHKEELDYSYETWSRPAVADDSIPPIVTPGPQGFQHLAEDPNPIDYYDFETATLEWEFSEWIEFDDK
jgi:hypothetical protein